MPTKADSRRRMSWSEVLGLAALAVAIGLLIWSSRRLQPGPMTDGIPLPPIMAEGWINTDRSISREDLLGKIVVVDCWFLGCPPCRASMPDLARLYEKYHPRGVEFVGLTPDTESQLPEMQEFIRSVPGFVWPVGYGTAPTLDVLGVSLYPTLLVFGPSGTAIWSGNHVDGLPEVLDEALGSR